MEREGGRGWREGGKEGWEEVRGCGGDAQAGGTEGGLIWSYLLYLVDVGRTALLLRIPCRKAQVESAFQRHPNAQPSVICLQFYRANRRPKRPV